MPLEYSIDHDRQIVFVRAIGDLTEIDFYTYQETVWVRSTIQHYSELIDMTAVGNIIAPSAIAIKDLADTAARTDPIAPAERKVAIVVHDDRTYGLGRMYEQFRTNSSNNRTAVSVFREFAAARAWLNCPE